MKKALVMLLAVLLCVCVIGGVASADRDHPDDDAKYESLEALNQATSGKKCSSGWTWIEPWQRTETVKKGYRKYTRQCETKSPILGIPMTNVHSVWVKEAPSAHTHTLVKHDAVAATCMAKGNVEYYTCSDPNCPDSGKNLDSTGKVLANQDVSTPIDLNAHDWGEWVETKAPTCMAMGEEKRVCKLNPNHVQIRTTKIEPDAHDWDDGVVTTEPTCETEGVKTYTCQNNSEHTKTEPISAKGHDLKKVEAVSATCMKDGNKEYWVCQREGCGKLFSDSEGKTATTLAAVTIKALNHDFKNAEVKDYDAKQHVYLCNRCKGEEEGGKQYEDHVASAWACKDEDVHVKKCTVCGRLMATEEHTYGAGVVTKMPTCWSKGEVKYTCTKCGFWYTKELPALGHYFETVTIESTCTGEGYTAQKCIRCGLIVSQGVLDPAGHKPGDWEVTKAATCTEKGQEVKYCTVCGVVVEMRDIDALGHDWGEWETVKEPTTEEEGEEKRVCKRDASHVETRPIAKLEPTPTPAPTETPVPTEEPTVEPTAEPTEEPTAEPTAEPTEPTEPGESGSTDIPKTGDNSRTGYVYLMMALAAAGLCALAVTRRKESNN